MVSAAVDRSRVLLAAEKFGEVERALRAAAESGDVDATLELGWLLGLSRKAWGEFGLDE